MENAKKSKPTTHISSSFAYFRTTVAYTTVRRLMFETPTTSLPVLLILFLGEFTLILLVFLVGFRSEILVLLDYIIGLTLFLEGAPVGVGVCAHTIL